MSEKLPELSYKASFQNETVTLRIYVNAQLADEITIPAVLTIASTPTAKALWASWCNSLGAN